MRGDAECGTEIGASSSQQTIGSPHNQSHGENNDDLEGYAEYIGENWSELSTTFDALLFLLSRQLRGLRAFFNLLADIFAPVHSQVEANADRDDEGNKDRERQQPTGLSDDVFKRFARREENADDAAERTQRCLRLRRRSGSCCHRGILHHKIAQSGFLKA